MTGAKGEGPGPPGGDSRAEDLAAMTLLLNRAAGGDGQAAEEVFPLVYEHMRRIARARMRGERAEHTLAPTILVHEAYLRLFGDGSPSWRSRGEFFYAASLAMRRLLVEHARGRERLKRGGGRRRLSLAAVDPARIDDPSDLLALDDALERLEAVEPRAARVVQMRYFAGLSVEEVAEAMALSPRTVAREWSYARAWLARDLGQAEEEVGE